MDRLHICAIGIVNTFDSSFRKQGIRLLIPVALLVFNYFRMSGMVFSDTDKMKGVFFKIKWLIEFSYRINIKLVWSSWQFFYQEKLATKLNKDGPERS